MEKNWLIRTKTNHILGPVSKDKVLELYKNGTIKGDDEICSGNGFWFFVREEDMVGRYLLGTDVQNFNPISEAKDVLTAGRQRDEGRRHDDDITMVGAINTAILKNDPHAPTSVMGPSSSGSSKTAEIPKKKSTKPELIKAPVPKREKKTFKKQNWLEYVFLIIVLVLAVLIYFRKSILRKIMGGEMTTTVISFVLPSAVAQEPVPEKKKSSLTGP